MAMIGFPRISETVVQTSLETEAFTAEIVEVAERDLPFTKTLCVLGGGSSVGHKVLNVGHKARRYIHFVASYPAWHIHRFNRSKGDI
jgi:hypothetical protein